MTNQRRFDLVLQSVRDDRRPIKRRPCSFGETRHVGHPPRASLAALYAAIMSRDVFRPNLAPFPAFFARATRVHLPKSTQRLKVRTPDGESLVGLQIPGMGVKTDGAPSLLGFGGNAWNARTMVLILHRLFPDRSVIGFHYRGYRAEQRQAPALRELLSDSLVVFDHLRAGAGHPTLSLPLGFARL